VRILAARVGHFGGISEGLLDTRNHLAPDRIIGVGGMQKVEKVGRDRGCEFSAGEEESRTLLFGKSEMFFELRKSLERIFKLPSVRVPVLGRDIGKAAGSRASELNFPLVNGVVSHA
jgi:hypothetical protein